MRTEDLLPMSIELDPREQEQQLQDIEDTLLQMIANELARLEFMGVKDV